MKIEKTTTIIKNNENTTIRIAPNGGFHTFSTKEVAPALDGSVVQVRSNLAKIGLFLAHTSFYDVFNQNVTFTLVNISNKVAVVYPGAEIVEMFSPIEIKEDPLPDYDADKELQRTDKIYKKKKKT